MARGVTVTGGTGGGTATVIPRPGSIKIKAVPKDVGGDGIPNVRVGLTYEVSFEVAIDGSDATFAELSGLKNKTTGVSGGTCTATDMFATTITLADAVVTTSLGGDGIGVYTVTVRGNKTA